MRYKLILNNSFFLSMTMVIVIITSVVTIFQFIFPEMLNILQRDPVKLTPGEWWRMITPLLVHADGWGEYMFNIIGIILIGFEVEKNYRKITLFFLYFAGGLIGEMAGYSWERYGAGASIGLCRLVGGIFSLLI